MKTKHILATLNGCVAALIFLSLYLNFTVGTHWWTIAIGVLAIVVGLMTFLQSIGSKTE